MATAETSKGRQIVIAYVRKPGADEHGRGKELLEALAGIVPIVIFRWNGRRTLLLSETLAHLAAELSAEANTQAIVDSRGELKRLPLAP